MSATSPAAHPLGSSPSPEGRPAARDASVARWLEGTPARAAGTPRPHPVLADPPAQVADDRGDGPEAYALLERVQEPVLLVGAHGRVLWGNAVYRHLTGFASGQLRGRTPRQLGLTIGDGFTLQQLREVLRARGSYTGPVEVRRADGSQVRMTLAMARVESPAGGAALHLLTLREPLSAPAPEAPHVAHAARGRPHVLRTLEKALRSGGGGEVVVRAGQATGRIYVHQGRVAWAQLSTLPTVFLQALVRAGLPLEQVRAVMADCQRTGANFGEAVVRRGLMPRERLRALLRQHVAERLAGALRLEEPVVLFVRRARTYRSELLFTLEELLDERHVRGAPPA